MDIQIAAIKFKKLVEFLDEVEGRLEELEGDILRLENPQDSEPLEPILRSIHTVWESASSFGLTSVQILSHEIETLLDTVRSRSIPVSTDGLIDTLLNGLDILAEIIFEVQKAVAAADRSADPVTLTVNDPGAEESLAALRSFKKCTQAEEIPEPSVAPLLTAEELEAICYPMDMDVLFVEESREHIEILEESLIELEEDINNPDLVNTIFRSLHSLKGSGGVLVSTVPKEEQRERHPITVLQKLAHAAEGAIQGVRDQKKRIPPAMIDTLLQVVDRLKLILTGFVERDPTTARADNLIMACRKISADVSDDSGKKDADKKIGQKDQGERFALANTLSQCLEACEIGIAEISDPEKRKTAIDKVGRSIKTVKKVCDKLQLAPQAKNAEAVLDMVASLSDTEEAGDALLIDVISADCNTLRDDVLALVSENEILSPLPPPSQTISSGDRKEDPPETAIASAVASTIKVPH
ncbi:Hpt domain-containing protein, partial [Desulfobulbus sp. US4]|nr:Hpt domain-containing protein [Desulfobulbus sp. US4]